MLTMLLRGGRTRMHSIRAEIRDEKRLLLILSLLSIRIFSCPEYLPRAINSLNATGMEVRLLINFARPKPKLSQILTSKKQRGSL